MFKREVMSAIFKENMEQFTYIDGVKYMKVRHYKDTVNKTKEKIYEANKSEYLKINPC